MCLTVRPAELRRKKRTPSVEMIPYAESQRRDATPDGCRDEAMARRKAQRRGRAVKSKGRGNPSKTAKTDATFHDGKRRREGGR